MANINEHIRIQPISPAASGPLYRQIVDGIKSEISEGRLRPGQSLPSFRVLAEDLMVSMITVKRAYEELEREGIIFRKQGLGTYISDDGAAKNRDARLLQAEDLMGEAVRIASDSGMRDRDIIEMARRMIQNRKGDNDDGKIRD